MNYKNVRFKWGNGKFVESSKNLSEGFEKITYTDPETKEEKITYHKFYDSVVGIISSVGLNETQFGKFLKVNVKTGADEITSIQVPYEDKYGYSRETKALISSLRGYELGEEIVINPLVKSFKRKNGKDGMDVNFYINYKNKKNDEGKSLSTGYVAFTELPPLEVEEKRGQKTYNNDKQMDFYYNILQEVIVKFEKYWEEIKTNKDNTTGAESSTVEQSNSALEPNEEFNEDDLPF